jgi:hypothetical protein
MREYRSGTTKRNISLRDDIENEIIDGCAEGMDEDVSEKFTTSKQFDTMVDKIMDMIEIHVKGVTE